MQFPNTSNGLTPEWLTRALRHSGAIENSKIESIDVSTLDGGIVGEVNQIRITYDRNELGAPQSVIAKQAHLDIDRRRRFRDFYEVEIDAYRYLSSEPTVSMPALHFAGLDDSGFFVLLLEDLGPFRVVDQQSGVELEDARRLMQFLADLHSRWWDDKRLLKHDWLPKFGDRESLHVGEERYASSIEAFLEITAAHLPDGVETIARKLTRQLASVRSKLSAQPLTLNHGDFRLANLFFDDSDEIERSVILVDWQMVTKARPGVDLGVNLLANLTPENRRLHEEQLLEEYFDRLMRNQYLQYSRGELLADIRRGLLMRFAVIVDVVLLLWKGDIADEPQLRDLCQRLQALVDWDCAAVITPSYS